MTVNYRAATHDDQMDLVSFERVKEEIKRSKAEKSGQRIKWADYLGKSLNKAVAELHEKGLDKQSIYKTLSTKLSQQGVDDKDFYRKLHIGVSARTSEGDSRDKQRRHIRHKTGTICPTCGGHGRIQ